MLQAVLLRAPLASCLLPLRPSLARSSRRSHTRRRPCRRAPVTGDGCVVGRLVQKKETGAHARYCWGEGRRTVPFADAQSSAPSFSSDGSTDSFDAPFSCSAKCVRSRPLDAMFFCFVVCFCCDKPSFVLLLGLLEEALPCSLPLPPPARISRAFSLRHFNPFPLRLHDVSWAYILHSLVYMVNTFIVMFRLAVSCSHASVVSARCSPSFYAYRTTDRPYPTHDRCGTASSPPWPARLSGNGRRCTDISKKGTAAFALSSVWRLLA